MEAVRRRLGAAWILPNHLIGCDWAVRPTALRAAAQRRGLQAVPVLVFGEERLEL